MPKYLLNFDISDLMMKIGNGVLDDPLSNLL